jgi:hypothetical protein
MRFNFGDRVVISCQSLHDRPRSARIRKKLKNISYLEGIIIKSYENGYIVQLDISGIEMIWFDETDLSLNLRKIREEKLKNLLD